MIVNLISGPRNISTALMYSFAQRSDTRVLDEPFYAYYLHRSGADHPGRKEIVQSMPVEITDIVAEVAQHAMQHEVVFVKNMAHHLICDDLSFMDDWKNIFLIRDPWELIISFAKVIPYPVMNDIGLKRSQELFEQLGNASIVIDSNEVLKSPPVVLGEVCRRLGIEMETGMLSWQAGARPEDGIWAKYWYHKVHQSTGFGPPKTSREELPEHLKALYEEAKVHYDFLSVNSIKYATTIQSKK